MRRRELLLLASAAVLAPDVLKRVMPSRMASAPDVLTYLDRQIMPAAAAKGAADRVSDGAGYGKLGEGDIFWSVMWPYRGAASVAVTKCNKHRAAPKIPKIGGDFISLAYVFRDHFFIA